MRSEAQKRADKKYNQSEKYKYKTVGIKIHNDNLNQISNVAKATNVTVPKYMARAAFYCAINNIDLSDFTQDFRTSKDKPQGEDNEK